MKLAIFFCLLLDKDFENQPTPELLLKLSDTVHSQHRYTEHVHEEVSCQKYFSLRKLLRVQSTISVNSYYISVL